MKYSQNFNRDWEFYTSNLNTLEFWGGDRIPTVEYSVSGVSAKDCFYTYDSTGKLIPCKDHELVKSTLRFKKALNFQIKQWAEGFDDVGQPYEDYLTMFNNPPEWIKESLRNQVWDNRVLREYNERKRIVKVKPLTWRQKLLKLVNFCC